MLTFFAVPVLTRWFLMQCYCIYHYFCSLRCFGSLFNIKADNAYDIFGLSNYIMLSLVTQNHFLFSQPAAKHKLTKSLRHDDFFFYAFPVTAANHHRFSFYWLILVLLLVPYFKVLLKRSLDFQRYFNRFSVGLLSVTSSWDKSLSKMFCLK